MNILKEGKKLTVLGNITIVPKLENKVYTLRIGMFGPSLEETSDLTLPNKLYDVEKEFRNDILNSHFSQDKNTGVLLQGYKGQGKTINAKLLAIESKLPIILIDGPITAALNFGSFLMNVEQEVCILIDEFEKNFDDKYDLNGDKNDNGLLNQESLLTVMDGILNTKFKRLFIFTSNEKINDKFMNRPSRIKWFKEYQYMDVKQYNMIIDDLLENKEFKEDLLRNLPLQEATVDLLSSIINEINVLKKPYSKFRNYFNHIVKNIDYKIYYKEEAKEEYKFLQNTTLGSKPIKDTNSMPGFSISKVLEANDECFEFITSNKPYLMYNKEEKAKGTPEDINKKYFIKYIRDYKLVTEIVY